QTYALPIFQPGRIPMQPFDRGHEGVEVRPRQRCDLQLIRATEITERPSQHSYGNTPETSPKNAKWKQRLCLTSARPKDKHPARLHLIPLRCLSPAAMPCPGHERAGSRRSGVQGAPDVTAK